MKSSVLIKTPDYLIIKNYFLDQLRAASGAEKSSLSYIKNVLPDKPLATRGIAQAVVIGGTNYQFATIKIDHDNVEIIDLKKGILPQLKNSDVFLKILKENFNPYIDAVGLNLAFPLEPELGRFD